MSDSRIGLGAAVVFALTLTVYAVTLYPTVPGGDAGELIVVAQHHAVAHPPGYPLWTMLAWLATLVPAGSMAWRVAWLSAIPAAAASALVFWCVASWLSRREVEGSIAGASAALAASFFAFSPTVWLYAVGAEVFPLHVLFVALLFALALAWQRGRDPRLAVAIAFTMGLGLTNHLTLVFYVVPIAAWMLWTGRRELLTGPALAHLAFAGLAGLTPYAYLWIVGRMENPWSWGDTGTWSGFVVHLLRRDYGTLQLLPSGHAASSTLSEKFGAYVAHAANEISGPGVLFVAGAIVLTRARDSFVLLVSGCLLFYLIVFLSLANVAVGDSFLLGVLARFWMQADVAFAILFGIGFALACAAIAPRRPRMIVVATALLVVLHVGMAAPGRLGRGDAVVEDYGRAILEPLPKNTLLLTKGDLVTNVVRYLQSAERLREDVVVLDQELMTKPWYVRRMAVAHPDVVFPGARYHPSEAGGFSMSDFLEANRARDSIRIYPEWKEGDPSIEGRWRAWPDGLASDVRPASAAIDPSRWTMESAAALAKLEARGWPSIDDYEKGSWERVALEDLWQARHRRAVVVLTEAIARGNDRGLLTIARGELEASRRAHPDPPAALLKNLGIAASRLAPSQPWLKKEELAAWKSFLDRADPEDPDRAAVEARVRELEGKP